MAALPYMQLYVSDYLADTLYLDVIESGAYLHLLMNYWQTGKPLPNDDKKLARISKCTEEQWLNVRSTVVDYFVEQDGQLIHERVDRDLEKVRQKSEAARKAGQKSGKTRRNKQKTNVRSTSVQANVERTQERNPNHTDTDTDTDTDTELSYISTENDKKSHVKYLEWLEAIGHNPIKLKLKHSTQAVAWMEDGITREEFDHAVERSINALGLPPDGEPPPVKYIAKVLLGVRSETEVVSAGTRKSDETAAERSARIFAADVDNGQATGEVLEGDFGVVGQ